MIHTDPMFSISVLLSVASSSKVPLGGVCCVRLGFASTAGWQGNMGLV
jgi:hypothetical protein